MIALEAGAEDVKMIGAGYMVITRPEDFENVKLYLLEQKLSIAESEVTMLPQTVVSVENAELATRITKLIDALEDHDDVQNVYANYELSAELMI